MINRTLWGIPVEIDEAATTKWYSKQEPCAQKIQVAVQKKHLTDVHQECHERRHDCGDAT